MKTRTFIYYAIAAIIALYVAMRAVFFVTDAVMEQISAIHYHIDRIGRGSPDYSGNRYNSYDAPLRDRDYHDHFSYLSEPAYGAGPGRCAAVWEECINARPGFLPHDSAEFRAWREGCMKMKDTCANLLYRGEREYL